MESKKFNKSNKSNKDAVKIIVAIKCVIDPESVIHVNTDGKDIIQQYLPTTINPFDAVALEGAISLKKTGRNCHILAVSIGLSLCQKVLCTALASGADEALFIEANQPSALTIAKVLAELAREQQADLIFFGKQAIDSDANQTGQMTAALLGWGQGACASALELTDSTIEARCDNDTGTETLSLTLPAVITAALRLNEPPILRLPALIAAQKKTIKRRFLSEFSAIDNSILSVIGMRTISSQKRVIFQPNVEALAQVIVQCYNKTLQKAPFAENLVLTSDEVTETIEKIPINSPVGNISNRARVLVFIECLGTNRINNQSLSAITAARSFGLPVDVLIAGQGITDLTQCLAITAGVCRVLYADDIEYLYPLTDRLAQLIAKANENIPSQDALNPDRYSHFIAAATGFGKNLMPRIAALLNVEPVASVTRIIDANTFERYVYAGRVAQTLQCIQKQQVISICTTHFSPEYHQQPAAPVIALQKSDAVNLSHCLGVGEVNLKDSISVSTAQIVVAGGGGFPTAESFERYLSPLAQVLGAAIGASRQPVALNFCGSECLIGQTGQSIAPELYLAIGISGAHQHLTGIKYAKTVIAIDCDGQAPIFGVSDYGLVMNIEQLPELTSHLQHLLTE